MGEQIGERLVTEERFDRSELSTLTDWRLMGGRLVAWFDAPTHRAGSALVEHVAESGPSGGSTEFDLRARGLRVRTEPSAGQARQISAIAAGLGLRSDPYALAELGLVIDTADQTRVAPFWRTVLGDQSLPGGVLADPLRRNPVVRFERLGEPRPLRNRLHLDVGRLADAVDSARAELGLQPHGPFGVALSDEDGNEVDLCPGRPLSPDQGTTDWQTMFSALAFYPTTTPAQAAALVAGICDLADEARRQLLIDVRPEGVMIDSGKDQWESPTGAADPDFVQLAARIQSTAGELGLTADSAPYRFVQIGIDAVDVPAVRGFWKEALGYAYDPRSGVTDLYDPRRLNPVIFFQGLDPQDEDRRRQRNRLHIELSIPADRFTAVLERSVAAGGRVLDEEPDRQPDEGPRLGTVADPEGNELRLVGC